MEICNVEDVMKVACHKKTYPSQKQGLVAVNTLGSEDVRPCTSAFLKPTRRKGNLRGCAFSVITTALTTVLNLKLNAATHSTSVKKP